MKDNSYFDNSLYKPDFPFENWTHDDRFYLESFVSNMDGFVSVLRNLPPEIVGALCARTSRASGSLLRVFLDEYIYPIANGDDKKLVSNLKKTVTFLKKHGFKDILNNQRAQQLFAKWLSQFGDDSIGQLTGTHVVFWGISQVAMKYFEDRRIGLEPLEKSTRFVNFSEKINGRYLYYIPYPDLEKYGLLDAYKETLDNLFDTYKSLIPILTEYLKKHFNDKEFVLEKKAFDSLRGLLPMATLGQVAFRGNAQAFEYLINRTAKYPLGEFRYLSDELRRELNTEIPSLLLRLNDPISDEYQEYLIERDKNIKKIARKLASEEKLPSLIGVYMPSVSLVEYDPFAENKIITGLIFPNVHTTWEKIFECVCGMSNEEKLEILEKHFEGRTRRFQKVARAFENSYLRWEIVMDAGAYRDLHRHRMLTQERQLFSIYHGFDVPHIIEEAGISVPYINALERVKSLFFAIHKLNPLLAQYTVPLAARMRFYQLENFRELFWETELRTTSQCHENYRHIELLKYNIIKEKFPLIAKFIMVDTNDYPIPRRGMEEKAIQKEEKILDSLGSIEKRNN